jgi:hypothetical protein
MELATLLAAVPFSVALLISAVVIARLHYGSRDKTTAFEQETLRYRSAQETERGEREEKLALSLAIYQRDTAAFNAQTALAMAALVTGQKQTTVALKGAEKRITAAGATSAEGLAEAIAEVLRGIVKLTSGQIDQTTALNLLKEAVTGLADMLKETPGSEEMGREVESMATDIGAASELGVAS